MTDPRAKGPNCDICNEPYAHHDKEKVFNTNPRAPPGSWSYNYVCTEVSN